MDNDFLEKHIFQILYNFHAMRKLRQCIFSSINMSKKKYYCNGKWFSRTKYWFSHFIFSEKDKTNILSAISSWLESFTNLLIWSLRRRKLNMNSLENSSSIIDQTSSYVTSKYECEEPYPNQKEILSSVSWWLDGFIQIIIGCMGFAGNTIAIPVLSSRKLSSIFNRILVFLAGINSQRLFYL